MKKIIIAVIIASMMISCLFGCSDDVSNETQPSDLSTEDSENNTETSTNMDIALENYCIVLAQNVGNAAKQEVNTLNDAISDICGTPLISKFDNYKGIDGEIEYSELEILIGATNRGFGDDFTNTLRYHDYGYTISKGKVAVVAHTDEALAEGIKLFAKDLTAHADDVKAFLSSETSVSEAGEYEIDTLTLNGKQIKDFFVVYPAGGEDEKMIAEDLAQYFTELSGYFIKCGSDKEIPDSENALQILVGRTDRSSSIPDDLGKEESYIAFTDGKLQLYGAEFAILYRTQEEFCEMFNKTPVNKTLKVSVIEPIRQTIDPKLLKIMSYNILKYNPEGRVNKVIGMIKKYSPDVFGINEGSSMWLKELEAAFPEYAWVGTSIDGTTYPSEGEYNAIFYRKDKFTLVEWETKWLSNTPDVVNSKLPESNNVRNATFALFKRNSDGKMFVHVCAHLQHDSYDARGRQAEIVVELIKEKGYQDYPIFITGDMNDIIGSRALNAYTNNGFVDSSTIAKKAITGSTFHDYTNLNIVIDFCMVSKGKIAVQKYKVCTDKINGNYPSDHHPVYVEAILLA